MPASKTPGVIPAFSSRLAFVFAAAGAAVGLGNVWKFPYTAGENGGAAFVAVYLIGLAILAAPIFISEVLIGRRGGGSPPKAMGDQAVEHGRSAAWRIPGLAGVIGNLVVMSFYSVIAGWTLDYMISGATGLFDGLTQETSGAHFNALQASAPRLLLWQGAFILMTVLIVRLGVRGGIERAVSIMMPALGALLVILVGYALIEGEAGAALSYLFAPDFSKLTPQVTLAAFGQALFTVSVGIGGVMMYGAYLPKGESILRASGYVILADTAVALLAGLAIFPVVFANGLDPAEGPGLVFVTLPLAFAEMPLGGLLGTLFFFFLFIAALTSAISLYEPTAAHLEEKGVDRHIGVWIAAGSSWAMGLLSLLSFNLLSDWHPLAFIAPLDGMTPFALITGGIDKIVLPVGALLIAWFAGRVLSREAVMAELGVKDGPALRTWRFAVRWLTPALILVLFAANLV